MPELAVLGLGSNLGDRESNLAAAITSLGIYNDISDINSASFYAVSYTHLTLPTILLV